jgi:ATP-dependent DNA helicase RecG
MKTATELLEDLKQRNETRKIEAKVGTAAGTSILESICAFSNEPGLEGGYIILGVEGAEQTLFPDLKEYRVVGVSQPEKVSDDIATQCASVFNIPVRIVITTENINGARVVVIYVPELQPSEKPLYFKARGLPQGAFRRIGSTDQKCTEDDLLIFYQNRNYQTYESLVIPEASVEHDIDKSTLEEYRSIRSQASPSAPELNWNNEDLLIGLNCATRQDGKLRLTACGILIFGTQVALRRFFPMTRVDYIRVSGKEWVSDPSKRFDDFIETRDPLIRTIKKLVPIILGDLPRSFSLPQGHLMREEIPAVPELALREAIVNAVMHRSYSIHAPTQIIRYSNRLEIRNPGYSLKPEEDFGKPGSVTRNPSIASVLHDTRLAETKGSGLRVIQEAMQRVGLHGPIIDSDREKNQFSITFFFHHFLSEEDWKWLEQFRQYNLTNDEAKALVFCREAGAINNSGYRNLNHVDPLEASQHLCRLRDLGLLDSFGKGSGTFYKLSPLLQQPISMSLATDSITPASAVITPASDVITPAKEGVITPASDVITPAKECVVTPAYDSDSHERIGLMQLLPAELRVALSEITERTSPERMRGIILEVCSVRPFTSEEIAILLYRDKKYLTRQYLQPLVDEGMLEYEYPGKITHPQQAYRIGNKGIPR